ncbi:hypothetical protein B9Z55_016951 [Caenorhabditis nigoni]|uniref:CX domain-containing protein n=1 Tax=Caenorhabditis nigoni TaxID=1611254 RepID=A0A2G5T7F8_9PELO|nr:hypothetical protein B9Z55_016951 [Caenorhabditis nigoni]
MKLIPLLLLICSVSSFERFSANFHFSADGYAVIENSSEPFQIANREYYWERNFPPVLGSPMICETREDSYGWPLGSVRFLNGSVPKSLYYACPETSFCGFLTCHSKDMSIFVVFTIFFISMFLICFCYICYYRSQNADRRNEPFELNRMIPIILTTEPPIADGETETSMDEGTALNTTGGPRYGHVVVSRHNISRNP